MVHKEICANRGCKAEEGIQGNATEIPPHADTLGTYQGKAGYAAYWQEATTHIATKGDEVPVLAVLDEAGLIALLDGLADGIDIYACHHKGNIVKHAAQHTHEGTGQIDVVDIGVKPRGSCSHGSYLDKDINTETDTDTIHHNLKDLVLQLATG